MKIQLQDKSTWHKWFAWHPVCIENTWVWLETVQRRWNSDIGYDMDIYGSPYTLSDWEYKV